MRGDPSFSRAVQEGLLVEVTAELRSTERREKWAPFISVIVSPLRSLD